MSIEEIIRIYGNKADYYDMPNGKIFRLSEMFYDETNDETFIPVWQSEPSGGFEFEGYVKLRGNYIV